MNVVAGLNHLLILNTSHILNVNLFSCFLNPVHSFTSLQIVCISGHLFIDPFIKIIYYYLFSVNVSTMCVPFNVVACHRGFKKVSVCLSVFVWFKSPNCWGVAQPTSANAGFRTRKVRHICIGVLDTYLKLAKRKLWFYIFFPEPNWAVNFEQ